MEVRCRTLVGRDDELARLTSVIERLADGAGEALVLRGLAGVGKTALIRQLVRRVEEIGGCALVGRAAPNASVSLRILAEVALAAFDRGANLDLPALAIYRRAIDRLLGEAEVDSETSEADGLPHLLVVADALLHMVSGLASPRVIVFEDAHWAGSDSLPALEFLCDQAPSRGQAIVLTVRSDEPSDALSVIDRLQARRAVDVLDVQPLGAEAVEEMLRLCLEQEPDRALVDTIVARSEGRPLVVEELLSAAGPTGLTDVEAIALPASLVDSVGARLAQLTEEQLSLIVLTAELGLDVRMSILEELTGLASDTVGNAIAAAEASLLVEVSSGTVSFRHGLTRDGVLSAAPASLLRQVADHALARIDPKGRLDDDRLAAAAALVGHAGEAEGVARLRLEAGRRALKRGALETSHRWLSLARDSAADDYDLRAEASALLVESLSHSGQVVEAAVAGEEALRMARARGDPGTQRRIELAIIRTEIVAERWEPALRRLQDLDEVTARLPDALVLAARAQLGSGNAENAVDFASTIVDQASGDDRVVGPAVLCEALEVLGRVSRGHDLDAAAHWFEQAVRTAEQANLGAWRARALHELATIRQLDAGEVDLHEVALDAATEAGAFSVATGVLFHLGALHGVQFDAERALDEGRRGLDLARRLGTARQAAMAWIIIGQAHAVAGREPQARVAASEAMALAPDDAEIRGLAGGACTALALLLNERRAEAIAELSAAVAQLEKLPTKTPVSTWYVWPLLAALETENGADALATTDSPELRVARGFDALWFLAAAVQAGRQGETSTAAGLLDRAVDQFDRCPGFTGYRHLGLRLAAEAAIEDGWADPGPWLTDAAAWFETKGLARPAQAARSLAARAGVPIGRSRGEPVPDSLAAMGITSREVDVLSLLGDGLTNREIGERLYISPRTVKSHVEHLLTKTGSSNRAQLAALAVKHSLT